MYLWVMIFPEDKRVNDLVIKYNLIVSPKMGIVLRNRDGNSISVRNRSEYTNVSSKSVIVQAHDRPLMSNDFIDHILFT